MLRFLTFAALCVVSSVAAAFAQAPAVAGGSGIIDAVEPTGPRIVTQPMRRTTGLLRSVEFEVVAETTGAATYQWYFNDTPLSDGGYFSGSASSKLAISRARFEHVGLYAVKVTDATGSIMSSSVQLTVIGFTPIPANDELENAAPLEWPSGSLRTNNVNATIQMYEATPSNDVRMSLWYSITPPASGLLVLRIPDRDFDPFVRVYESTRFPGSTHVWPDGQGSWQYPIETPVRAGKTYVISVSSPTDTYGEFALEWAFTPAPPNDDLAGAALLAGDSGSVAGDNTAATGEAFQAGSADGTSSVWYAWTAPAAGRATFSLQAAQGAYPSLRVYSADAAGEGLQAKVAETSGSSSLQQAVDVAAGAKYFLEVCSWYRGAFTFSWSAQYLPTVTAEPQSVVAEAGGSATFTVAATGAGITYQWFHDGIKIPGATGASLTLESLRPEHVGAYYVVVTTSAGSTTSASATLRGTRPPPIITQPPQDAVLAAGQALSLSVQATGEGELSYQWLRDGWPIPGATSASLTLSSAGQADSGAYRVWVYDGLSGAVSTAAQVGVAPAAYPGFQVYSPAARQPSLSTAGSVSVVAAAPDGGFFVAGQFDGIGGVPRRGLARFNADGSLDASFVPPVLPSYPTKLLPLPNGGLIVGGVVGDVEGKGRGALFRLSPSGELDDSFQLFPLVGTIGAMAVDATGHLLLAGDFLGGVGFYTAIVRVTPDGQLDPDFRVEVGTAASGQTGRIRALKVLPSGAIYAAGLFSEIGQQGNRVARRGIARLLADGKVDNTFDTAAWSTEGNGFAMDLSGDGGLVVAGDFRLSAGGTAPVVWLTGSGALSAAMSEPVFDGHAIDVWRQPSGRVLVLDWRHVLRRLEGDGRIDASFSSRSLVYGFYRLALDASGRVLVGINTQYERTDPTLLRWSVDGAVDPSFTARVEKAAEVRHIANASGGKLLVTGVSYWGGVPVQGMVRLNPDYTLDETFSPPSDLGVPTGILPLPDGAVYCFSYESVVRLRADGSRDPAFAATPVQVTGGMPPAVLLAEGSLVVPAISTDWEGSPVRGLVAITRRGTRDRSFDVGEGTTGTIDALAVTPEGRLIVGGAFTTFGGAPRNRLVRLNRDGSIDGTFGVGTGFDGNVAAVALQGDGRVLVAGAFTSYQGVPATYLVRLNADGTRDTSYAPQLPSTVGAIHLQADGKLIVAAAESGLAEPRKYVLRLNTDGTADATWSIRDQPAPVSSIVVTDAGRLVAAARRDARYYGSTVMFGLVEYAPAAAPTITQPPSTVVTDVGAQAEFGVLVQGTRPFRYQWFFEGAPLPDARSARLSFANVQLSDAGRYHVQVENDFGSVESEPVLLKGANPVPTLTVPPTSVSTTGGAATTLSVVATGTGTLSYQWRRNGVAIPGATGATLDLGGASLALNGDSFDVRVYDGLSVTVSQPVTVSVVPAEDPQVLAPDPAYAASFETQNVEVKTARKAPDGRVYTVGTFSRVGSHRTWQVARYTAAGALDTTFRAAATNGRITSIDVQSDGKILLAGEFTFVGGVSMPYVGRLLDDGSPDRSFNPARGFTVDGCVRALPGGRVLLGTPGGLVCLLPDGALDSSFNAAEIELGGVLADATVQSDGRIIVAGSFGMAGMKAIGLARLQSDGRLDRTFNSGNGPSSSVLHVRVLPDDRLVVAGPFSDYDGVAQAQVVRLTPNGRVDPTWQGGSGLQQWDFQKSVRHVEIDADGRIVLAGFFRTPAGATVSPVRLVSNGALDASFGGSTDSVALLAVPLSDGGLLRDDGNEFKHIREGETVASWPLFSPAGALIDALPGGGLWAVGLFTHVNGQPRQGIARLNGAGELDATFTAAGAGLTGRPAGVVSLTDGSALVVGALEGYDGAIVPSLIRVRPDGSRDASFKPAFPDFSAWEPKLFPLSRGRALVTGSGGVPLGGRLVEVDGLGRVNRALDAPGSTDVFAAAEQPDGRIVLGGRFYAASGGRHQANLLRITSAGAYDTTFPGTDGHVYALAAHTDGKIVVGGEFLTIGSLPRPRLARLNADGSVDETFSSGFGPNFTVRQLMAQADGSTLVSGSFTTFDGSGASPFFVRVDGNGRLDPTFAVTGVNGPPNSWDQADDGSLLVSGGTFFSNERQSYGVVRLRSQAGPLVLLQPTGASLTAGQRLVLAAQVVGGSDVTYQWLKDGVPVSGATSLQLVRESAQPTDAGTYSLRITDGSTILTSNPATVTVAASAPVWAEGGYIDGFGAGIPVGSLWPLRAPRVAVGSGPLSYQWFKSDQPIPGATEDHLTILWRPEHAGTYRVQVAGAAGRISSQPFMQAVTGAADWTWRYPRPQGNPLYTSACLNGDFLVGGARGTVLRSADGVTWTLHRLRVAESVVGFAYGAGRYVALTSFGGVWSSGDGAEWLRHQSGVAGEDLRAVAFHGGRFVAVGSGGSVSTSPDGMTWSATSLAEDLELVGVAGEGGQWVAVDSSGRTMRSTDGVNWQSGVTFPHALRRIAGGNGAFVLIGEHRAYASLDGSSWVERQLNNASALLDVQYTPGGFLAATDKTTRLSADGFTWGDPILIGDVPRQSITSVTGNGSRYVLTSLSGDALFTSPNRYDWSQPTSDLTATSDIASVASNGEELVAVGSLNGESATWSSADGSSWTPWGLRSVGTGYHHLFAVAYGAGRFVGVGTTIMVRAADGSWSEVAWPGGAFLYGLTHANGLFVAVGTNSTVCTSPDGLNWTRRGGASASYLNAIAYGAGTWVAGGPNGLISTSTDLTTWTVRPTSGLSGDIHRLAYGGGQFVAATDQGLWRSTNGLDWVQTSLRPAYPMIDVLYAGGQFHAFLSGNTATATSRDGITWTFEQHGSARTTRAAVVHGEAIYLFGEGQAVLTRPIATTTPVFSSVTPTQLLREHDSATLTTTLQADVPGTTYQWYKDGSALVGQTGATLMLTDVGANQTGEYVVYARSAGGTAAASVRVAVNVLSRGLIAAISQGHAASAQAVAGAFSVEGTSAKRLLVRVVGPGLAAFEVTDAMSNPALRIVDAVTGQTVAQNDDWGTASNVAEITQAAVQVGAYPLATADAAVLQSFAPGSYRVEVEPVGAAGQISLEVYDTDENPRLVYSAVSALIPAGGELAQAFAVMQPSAGRVYVVRALGRSFGGAEMLATPSLRVENQDVTVPSSNVASVVAPFAARAGLMPVPEANADAVRAFEPLQGGVFTARVSNPTSTAGAVWLEVAEVDISRADVVPLAIVSPPRNLSLAAGTTARFGVVAVGRPSVTFQWYKGDAPIAGATGSSLVVPFAQVADAGSYRVQVNSGASTASATAELAIAAVDNGVQTLHGAGVEAGATVTIANAIHLATATADVRWTTTLPDGWTLVSHTAAAALTAPAAGATGEISWTFANLTTAPVTFTYTARAPVTTAPSFTVSAVLTAGASTVPVPGLTVPRVDPPTHSADIDRNYQLSLLELTRVIELYNTRSGTTRTGCYRVQSGTTDGFAAEPTRAEAGSAVLERYHSADYNRDGKLSLLELTRVIELYNYRSGASRTGHYRRLTGTSDGFAPGP